MLRFREANEQRQYRRQSDRPCGTLGLGKTSRSRSWTNTLARNTCQLGRRCHSAHLAAHVHRGFCRQRRQTTICVEPLQSPLQDEVCSSGVSDSAQFASSPVVQTVSVSAPHFVV